jgi:hypothetical protein
VQPKAPGRIYHPIVVEDAIGERPWPCGGAVGYENVSAKVKKERAKKREKAPVESRKPLWRREVGQEGSWDQGVNDQEKMCDAS